MDVGNIPLRVCSILIRLPHYYDFFYVPLSCCESPALAHAQSLYSDPVTMKPTEDHGPCTWSGMIIKQTVGFPAMSDWY